MHFINKLFFQFPRLLSSWSSPLFFIFFLHSVSEGTYNTTPNSEDHNMNLHSRENLKSYTSNSVLHSKVLFKLADL
jgi:hypothetical protein